MSVRVCPTCHRRLPGGAQASPDLERKYVCAICYRPQIQKGAGRPRQICTSPDCNRRAQQRRKKELRDL